MVTVKNNKIQKYSSGISIISTLLPLITEFVYLLAKYYRYCTGSMFYNTDPAAFYIYYTFLTNNLSVNNLTRKIKPIMIMQYNCVQNFEYFSMMTAR